MIRTAVACAVTAAIVVAGVGAYAVQASSPPFVPACPHPTYSADGNLTPLFCKIANPAALKWYGKIYPDLANIGPNATPPQVYAIFEKIAAAHVALGEACQAYKLFAYRWGWHFVGGAAAVLPSSLSWCTN